MSDMELMREYEASEASGSGENEGIANLRSYLSILGEWSSGWDEAFGRHPAIALVLVVLAGFAMGHVRRARESR